MCGIAGFSRIAYQGDKQTLLVMGQAIAHRGPDDHGEYLDEGIGLCHRRLSIIDLSAAGHQPMASSDGRYQIVFNGEIYNFQSVREQLKERGYRFDNDTDTVVILAAYAEWGRDCLDHLNGMFAFALWDSQEQSLFLARDRMGKKPLYYYHDGTDLFFASELKALTQIPSIPRQIRTDAVYDFFAYQYIPDPKTIYQDIYKLEPGHCLYFVKGELKQHQYWDVSFKDTTTQSVDDMARSLIDTITQCTARRMVADVPLGAFLSGGVDSSGIVALMAKQSQKPVKTCSIGFDVEAFNETEFARSVAEQYHTEHHEFTVHDNVQDNLRQIVRFFDEPFADPSLVPTYFVSKLARQQVTVAVAGDGGDEVFAGYEKYAIDARENRLRDALPDMVNRRMAPVLSSIIRRTPLLNRSRLGRKAQTLLNTLSVDPAMGFYFSNAFINDDTWQTLINDTTRQALSNYHPSQITLDTYHQADGPDHLAKILYTDMKTYLCGGILTKVDRMSMANSLEVRAPLLDYKVVEYAATLPSAMKLADGDKKHILKQVFKPLLPDDILYRKKMGFSVPLAEWFRDEIKPLAEKALLKDNQGLTRFFKPEAIDTLWQQHQSGHYDHGTVLWSLLVFQLWWNEYVSELSTEAGQL